MLQHDGPAVGTSELAAAGSEQAGATDGLVGLQAVMSRRWKAWASTDDYREVLERIPA